MSLGEIITICASLGAIISCVVTLLIIAHKNGRQTERIENAVARVERADARIEKMADMLSVIPQLQTAVEIVTEVQSRVQSDFKDLRRELAETSRIAFRAEAHSHHGD